MLATLTSLVILPFQNGQINLMAISKHRRGWPFGNHITGFLTTSILIIVLNIYVNYYKYVVTLIYYYYYTFYGLYNAILMPSFIKACN